MFYIILRDNEAIKLHSQFLSINLNKNTINFNKAISSGRFNDLILCKGALFRTNDATRPGQFDYRGGGVCVRCPIIFILLSLSLREVYARDAFECYRGPTMVMPILSLDRKRRFCIHRVVCIDAEFSS